jgi:hypothetical protein
MNRARDEARLFEFTQLLRQHLVRDPFQVPMQFVVPPGAPVETPEDRHLPSPANHVQRQLDGILERLAFELEFRHAALSSR